MNANDTSINTGGGAYVEGDVDVDGDFAGRDLIQHLERKNVEGDYVERQEITQIFVVVPGAQEATVNWLANQIGDDKRFLENLGAQAAPEHVARQIEEVEAAQREAAAQGVPITPKAAYQLGMLAAYRREYQIALEYFQQATQADPEYSDAFRAIAWLQQYRAMDDINRRDYDAAISKLAAARTAAKQTDPLDARAMAMRGYIAKTLAQISEARGDHASREKYYGEAARLFEQAAKLNPDEPGAQNGLGNVQHALGNLDAAIEAYAKAIELAPNYTAAFHDLSLAYGDKIRPTLHTPLNGARNHWQPGRRHITSPRTTQASQPTTF